MSKLLLIGNDSLVRQGLRMRLAFEPGTTIVGEVDNGTEALSQYRTLYPDIIVMDTFILDRNVLATIESLRKAYHQCAIILLTLYDSAVMRVQAELAGATALVGKHDGIHVLLATIRQAANRT
jgi:two-component system response regulator EvgA